MKKITLITFILIGLLLVSGFSFLGKTAEQSAAASELAVIGTTCKDAVQSSTESVEDYNLISNYVKSFSEIQMEPVEIDYDNLFDFSGWEDELNDADNKEKYIDQYWRDVAYETFSDYKTYNLITSDKLAKEAFLNEVKSQMALQMESYLMSLKIPVDDAMKGFISDIIEQEMVDLEEAIE